MSLIAPIVALVVAIAGVVLAHRSGSNRALRMAVPMVAIPIACAEAFWVGRAALLEVADLPLASAVEVAEHGYGHIVSTEAFGLVCAVGACLVYAIAEATRGSLVNARVGAAIGLGGCLSAAVVAGLAGGGPLTLMPAFAVLLIGVACGCAAAFRVDDGEEAVSRALVVALTSLTAAVGLVMVQEDLWLLYASEELRFNAAVPAAVFAAVLGTAALVSQRFWEFPDRFGAQLVIGLLVGGSALMLRMPGKFVMDRLIQITPGGQVVVLEKRLVELPTADPERELADVEVLDGILNDGLGWWSSHDGRPVEFPIEADRVAVGVRSNDAATVLTDTRYAEHDVELEIWVQLERYDGGHPLESHGRYRWLTLTWMPEVSPLWSPDAPILSADGTVQELVDACLEGGFELCRITPAAPETAQ